MRLMHEMRFFFSHDDNNRTRIHLLMLKLTEMCLPSTDNGIDSVMREMRKEEVELFFAGQKLLIRSFDCDSVALRDM